MTAAAARPAAANRRSAAQPARPQMRRDPKPRHTDGTSPWMRLKGQDPDYHYVAVYKGGMAIEQYAAIGYDECRRGEGNHGGLDFIGGRTVREGDLLESMGHVIMKISLETWREQQQHGDGFGMGQDFGDMVEKRMALNRGGMEDPFRGMSREVQGYVRVGNNRTGQRALEQRFGDDLPPISAEMAEAQAFDGDDGADDGDVLSE